MFGFFVENKVKEPKDESHPELVSGSETEKKLSRKEYNFDVLRLRSTIKTTMLPYRIFRFSPKKQG